MSKPKVTNQIARSTNPAAPATRVWQLVRVHVGTAFWGLLTLFAFGIFLGQILANILVALGLIALRVENTNTTLNLEGSWILTYGITIFVGGLLSATTLLPLNLAAGYIRRDIAKSLLLLGGFFSILSALAAGLISVLSKYLGAIPIINSDNTPGTGLRINFFDPDLSFVGGTLVFFTVYLAGLLIGSLYRTVNSWAVLLLIPVCFLPLGAATVLIVARAMQGSWPIFATWGAIPFLGLLTATLTVIALASFWFLFPKTKIQQPT